MKPYYQAPDGELYLGDVIECLKLLPSESIHTCITSPPYWGLRNYGIESSIWGGDLDHEHEWGETMSERKRGALHGANAQAGNTLAGISGMSIVQGQFCRCGAWCGILGMEPTPEMFVAHMAEIFREVRRVLRNDGVFWLNIGDSYAGSGGPGSQYDNKAAGAYKEGFEKYVNPNKRVNGLKPKDLCGIPWRVAFALQADGWYLRSDIIWAKPNPMPESVTDRPTKSHEYLFLLTKAKCYFYNQEAVREPLQEATIERYKHGWNGDQERGFPGGIQNHLSKYMDSERAQGASGRNLRSVWTIATEPFAGAHFATFPTALVEPCVKAGTSERGCCPKCGAPWKRVVERTGHINKREVAYQPGNAATKTDSTGWAPLTRATDHWQPSCKCGVSEVQPSTVLDPFIGSGTTAVVARRLGRRWIGIDLSERYLQLSVKRLEGISLPLGVLAFKKATERM